MFIPPERKPEALGNNELVSKTKVYFLLSFKTTLKYFSSICFNISNCLTFPTNKVINENTKKKKLKPKFKKNTF